MPYSKIIQVEIRDFRVWLILLSASCVVLKFPLVQSWNAHVRVVGMVFVLWTGPKNVS